MLKCRQERAWAQCGMSICCAAGTAAFTQAPPRMWPGGSGSTRSEREPNIPAAARRDAGLHRGSTRPLCCPAPGSGHQKAARRQKLELIKNGFDDPDGMELFLWARVPQGKRNEILPLYSRKTKRRESDEKKRSGTNAGEAWEIVDRCADGVVSMVDDAGAPYAVPVNLVRRTTGCTSTAPWQGKRRTVCGSIPTYALPAWKAARRSISRD